MDRTVRKLARPLAGAPKGQTTGRDVAAHLKSTERAVDAAWVLVTDQATKSDPGLIAAMGQARIRLTSAQLRLGALADRMGLEPRAVGPLDKPEDNPPIGGGPGRKGRNVQS